MSRDEWEEGTIVIPAAAWPSFRTAIIASHNGVIEEDFADALAMLPKIKVSSKGLRGEAKVKAQWAALASACHVRIENQWDDFQVCGQDDLCDRAMRLYRMIFVPAEGASQWGPRKVLSTPKKKDLDLRPLTKDTTFNLNGDASIRLVNKTHSVRWRVGENNHACERARAYPLATVLFTLLGKIEWTRGSGGTIVGNDEYNQESREDGGGSNYVTADYGLAKKKSAFRGFPGRR